MKRIKAQNSTQAFEAALSADPPAAHYCLRLFVTGTTPRSTRAISNIRAICEANLAGRYDLEVIDIYQHPEQAQPDQIVVTPTLIKKLPLPFRRVIGDLSDNQRVLVGLDIVSRPMSALPSKNKHGA